MPRIAQTATPPPARDRRDSSTDRVLGLLDLFTVEQPVWTVDALVERQGLARATLYRYVKALADAGFLVAVGGGAYALGPRFIEMDRQIRLADPLLQVAPPVMEAQRDAVAGAQLLCRFYGLQVLCILQDRSDERLRLMFERGRPFSMFLGAPSRAILANLPSYQLQRMFLHHSREIAEARLGTTWIEFRDQMKAVRKTGYAVASDIDKALVGVAAPIFTAPEVVSASLCLVRFRREVAADDIDMLGELAVDAARRISDGLQKPKRRAAAKARAA